MAEIIGHGRHLDFYGIEPVAVAITDIWSYYRCHWKAASGNWNRAGVKSTLAVFQRNEDGQLFVWLE